VNLNMNAKDVPSVDTRRTQSRLELQNDIQRRWCHYAHDNESSIQQHGLPLFKVAVTDLQ
jgi:hypothetical protein